MIPPAFGSTTAHRYRQCSLGIHSECALPDLVEEPGDTDVEIRLDLTLSPPPSFDGRRQVELHACVAYHCWPTVGSFLVRDGIEILVRPADRVDPRLLGHFVARIAFASVLHQRGFTLLHGSAVAVNGDAIAIVGAAGAGKSALAAALHVIGCPVLADDVVVVEERNGVPYVRPASQHLQIWPAVAAALGYGPSLRRVVEAETKLVVPTRSAWPPDPLPLRFLACVEAGETVGLSRLPPAAGCRALIAGSFINHIAADRVEASTFDERCRRMASTAACLRLTMRDVAADVRTLAALIVTEIRLRRPSLDRVS